MVSSSIVMRAPRPVAIVVFCAILFILNGISLIPYPGVQNDEAFFSGPFYDPEHVASGLRAFGRPIPLMHLSYVGTLKTWLYAPVLKLWPPGRYTVRLPALLMGASTIVLFFLLVRRAAGAGAGLIGAAALAADPVFLLTNLFDWGPVVLQFLLTVGGCYCLLRFAQTGSRTCFSFAFFLFGLALWHKAVFLWILLALLAGTLLLFREELTRASTGRNFALAVLWFSIGAFPFLRYNIQRPLATFRENAGLSLSEAGLKARVMHRTLDGSGLFGYMVWEDPPGNPLSPESALERISCAISGLAGQPRRTVLPWLTGACLLVLPWLWRTPARRPVLFAAAVVALTWTEMLFAKGAGGAIHHTVLAWPWPYLLIGASLAGVARRFPRIGPAVALTATLGACASGLLVINQYRAEFIRNGAKQSWTDAIHPLSALLSRLPSEQVILVDWGMLDNLRLLSQGKLPLLWASAPLVKPTPNDSDRREVLRLLAVPGGIFVAHTDDHQQFAGINERLRRISSKAGFLRELLYVVRDRTGRAVFEVFRFRPAAT